LSAGGLSLEDESYAMANLSPRMTGLSRHVFVAPRMGSHDIRIKVSVAPGKNTLPTNCASIGLRPSVHHVAGAAVTDRRDDRSGAMGRSQQPTAFSTTGTGRLTPVNCLRRCDRFESALR
jgi:hypothetical protein